MRSPAFVSENRIYPDKDTAIVVLTNLEATSAARLIADRVSELVLTPDPVDASVRQMFLGLQKGVLDRTRLTPDLNDYFTALTIGDFATSLGPLGTPSRFAPTYRRRAAAAWSFEATAPPSANARSMSPSISRPQTGTSSSSWCRRPIEAHGRALAGTGELKRRPCSKGAIGNQRREP